ncbi:MAG: ABC transporter ATP-binding protein [Pseudomonadota bacterium]
MAEIDVELLNVTKRWGNFVAVDNISLQVEKGAFCSLLGPSGCGKTTVMRMISGFESPTEGTVRIAGEDMGGRKPFKRPTNLVFQHHALFPHLTVAENIAFGLKIKKLPREDIQKRVTRMLELVQLPALGDRKISQLSGGQRQRIAIARALVNEPTVLLLDEPLSALDLKLREQMQLELKRIQNEIGTTFVFVTHDQKEAITMSDVIAVINKGVVEQMASSSDIYERPATEFVAGFIGETNLLKGNISAANGNAASLMCEGEEIRVKLDRALPEGTPISVSIRPERIALNPVAQDDANTYEATVRDAIYQGSVVHYRIVTAKGLELGVDITNSGRQVLAGIGDKVKIGWPIERGVPVVGSGA